MSEEKPKRKISPSLIVAVIIIVVLLAALVYYATLPPAPPTVTTVVMPTTTVVTTVAPPTTPPPVEKKVTWATIAGFYTDWAEQVSKNFTAKTGIKVEVIPIDYSVLYEKQMIELAGKTGAFDIVTVESMCIAEWASAGWLEPLDDYIRRTPPEEIMYDDILEHFRWVLTWGGKCYGLPYYTYDQGVFYRKDLFQREDIKEMYRKWSGHELKEPGPDMTWDEVVKIAEFFDEVVPDDIMPYGIGLMAGPVESNDEWMAIMWGLGGDHFDKDYNIIVNSTESVRAMEIYLELLKHAPPGALASSYDEVVAQMQRGLIPMTGPFYLDQWPNMVKTEKLIPGAKMGINAPVMGRGYIGCFALSMDAASKRKDYAWEFLKWLAGPEGQYSFAVGGGSTCRRSVLLNPRFDPEKNPATYPYTAHYKYLVQIDDILRRELPDWQKPYRIFKIPKACSMYLESKITIGSIAAGQATPKGGLDRLALAYATMLGWGYPVPSMKPPSWWKPPPD